MSRNKWELDAILEGLALRDLDKQEQNALFGFNLRYILNHKKPQMRKVIDKPKLEKRIRNIFKGDKPKKERKANSEVLQAMEYFKRR